jgi:iron complex outermembrane receptor protein
VEQKFPLRNGAHLVGGARAHYQTKSYTGGEFLPDEVQDSYATADFSLTYSAASERYYFTGYVNNAFDKTILGYSNPVAYGAFLVGTLRPPRTFGFRVGVHL